MCVRARDVNGDLALAKVPSGGRVTGHEDLGGRTDGVDLLCGLRARWSLVVLFVFFFGAYMTGLAQMFKMCTMNFLPLST